jgi:hypothetical protein
MRFRQVNLLSSLSYIKTLIFSSITGLAWLIKSIHTQLSATFPEKEVSTICNDLIWALFICPAVTNPEPFGVTDTPVGSQARHTLSQVATILQSLALHPFEGTDPRLTEYISYFDPVCCLLYYFCNVKCR